jgi:hypothetical protein
VISSSSSVSFHIPLLLFLIAGATHLCSSSFLGCEGCGESVWRKPHLLWNLCRVEGGEGRDRPLLVCGDCLARYKKKKEYCPICCQLYPLDEPALDEEGRVIEGRYSVVVADTSVSTAAGGGVGGSSPDMLEMKRLGLSGLHAGKAAVDSNGSCADIFKGFGTGSSSNSSSSGIANVETKNRGASDSIDGSVIGVSSEGGGGGRRGQQGWKKGKARGKTKLDAEVVADSFVGGGDVTDGTSAVTTAGATAEGVDVAAKAEADDCNVTTLAICNGGSDLMAKQKIESSATSATDNSGDAVAMEIAVTEAEAEAGAEHVTSLSSPTDTLIKAENTSSTVQQVSQSELPSLPPPIEAFDRGRGGFTGDTASAMDVEVVVAETKMESALLVQTEVETVNNTDSTTAGAHTEVLNNVETDAVKEAVREVENEAEAEVECEVEEDRMVQCNECSRWVHALCEGIDQTQYEAMTRGTHPVWVSE